MTATAPLTDQQLADIAARANAATPGPWCVYESGTLIDVAADLEETGHGYRARRGIARFDDEPLDNDPTHSEWTAEEDWAQVQADAAFTAHARGDVDALVAEVRRLRARVTELDNAPLCGQTWGVDGNEYSPCARREGHEEAYCRSSDGNRYFLAVAADQPAVRPVPAAHEEQQQ